MDSYNEIFSKLNSEITSIAYKDYKCEIPEYPDIKSSKETYYNSHRKVLEMYNEVCGIVSRLQYLQSTILHMQTYLKEDSSVLPRMRVIYDNSFKSLKEESRKLIEVFQPQKESLEYVLRFYTSISYALFSYRYE